MRAIAAILAAVTLVTWARAEDFPDPQPKLRIDPEIHTAAINRIGVNAACTLMVTASDDKTARLWVLPGSRRGSPELKRVFRVPIRGAGPDDGKLFAVAMSPDGKWIAIGGSESGVRPKREGAVYIFDATGQLLRRLSSLGNAILHLAFSPDGSRLAATLDEGQGMRLWRTADWELLNQDAEYGGKSFGASFDRANRLFTVASDGRIRRYGPDGRVEANELAEGGKFPSSVAVHPRNGNLAIGFNDTPAVEVYDALTLKRLYAAVTGGIEGDTLNAVAWSADGAQLYAAGRYQIKGSFPLLIWQDGGRGRRSERPLSQSTIMQLLPCGAGIAAGAQDPAFGLLAPDGSKRIWQERVTPDMRDKLSRNFTLSADGKRVRFGLEVGGDKPVLFDLTTFQLVDAPSDVAGLGPPKTTGLGVSNWKDSPNVKLSGKPISLHKGEMSRSFAIAADTSRFVLGTEWFLRAYYADGTDLWQTPKVTPGVAWGVNISINGKLAVAAYADGTIRWHRFSDGQELLALFVHAKDRRYIAWTPKGYHAASPGAEDLIGWHVNRDWDHAPDFFEVARFRDQFNRPDIVKRVLSDLDEGTAISEANRLAGVRQAEEIARHLPPVITIRSPGDGSTFNTDSLAVSYSLRSPSGLPVSEVITLVDGRPLPGATESELIAVSASGESARTLTLTGLPQRDLTLTLVARAGDLQSSPNCQDNPACIQLKFKGVPPVGGAPKGSLYALVVGINEFQDHNVPPLEWAAKDASDFGAALKQQEGRLYTKVDVKLLTDKDANAAAIINALNSLIGQVGKDDVGVLFLSGHGVNSPRGDYYYIPYNARIQPEEGTLLPERTTAVPDTEIRRALAMLNGKALFFFDTCHAGLAVGAGGLYYSKFVDTMKDAGHAIVLASSKGDELSEERAIWQHGAFTKALLDVMQGGANLQRKNGIVTIEDVIHYVKTTVPDMTRDGAHPQHPVGGNLGPDFDFVKVH